MDMGFSTPVVFRAREWSQLYLITRTDKLKVCGNLEKMAESQVSHNGISTSEANWLKCGRRNNKYKELRIQPVAVA